MLTKIDGSRYAALLGGGVANLEKNRTALNDLNVFPVPDGDTGTNMVMTLRRGYEAINGREGTLGELACEFSSAAVFGARGNSGVIVSQFFKGLSEMLKGHTEADCELFARALEGGCELAYASVAEPVEGTMLTVLKDASNAVKAALPLDSIDELVDIYLGEARRSLGRTPELLPVLKKAGVVDSGGSGIVCFFEGVKRVLGGEDLTLTDNGSADGEYVDFSLFNKDTSFEYGYCFEGLIQLTRDVENFDIEELKSRLSLLGSSMVVSLEGDKVKLHIHAKVLAPVMECCQTYGELLTVKIENMSVQNAQKMALMEKSQQSDHERFLYSPERERSLFAIVAVASNKEMQKRFFDMGADVVIMSEIAPSSEDFIEAFRLTGAGSILVFPNSSNSVLSAEQAAALYESATISVLECRSMAECYAALSVIDLDGELDDAAATADDVIANIYELSVYRATKDISYGSRNISRNDYFALSGKQILAVADTLEKTAVSAVKDTLDKRECALITLFYGKSVPEEYIEDLAERMGELDDDVEVAVVPTLETVCDITITFE